ncbi:hypothetical protein GCM10022419_109050 [Nonomuraea rosea]|uniref:Uncharacterized protein n=1 Tax=Nonomuraea rosea TaxID=638574 RepID=A0ABP6ZE39_9ACTN
MEDALIKLIQALTGRFDDRHAELARMLPDQIDGLNRQIEQLIAQSPQAQPASSGPSGSSRAAATPGCECSGADCASCRFWSGWMRSPGSARGSLRSSSPR